MMNTPRKYGIAALELSDTQYTVEQTGTDENFRPEYEAKDVTGDTIFRCTHNMYKEKDTFPFVNTKGTELFTVGAIGSWDIAGDYLLTDSQTGEDLVILNNDFSLLQDTWRIRDADDESLLAEISSRGAFYTVSRKILPVGQWLGHEFEVTDADSKSVGTIRSDFAVFDQYEITISDSSSVPIGPIVAGTVVIDAIQGN